jgi:hypothetical protein
MPVARRNSTAALNESSQAVTQPRQSKEQQAGAVLAPHHTTLLLPLPTCVSVSSFSTNATGWKTSATILPATLASAFQASGMHSGAIAGRLVVLLLLSAPTAAAAAAGDSGRRAGLALTDRLAAMRAMMPLRSVAATLARPSVCWVRARGADVSMRAALEVSQPCVSS